MAKNFKRALVFVKNSEISYVEEKTSLVIKLINQPYLEDLETIDTDVLTKSINLWKEKNKGFQLQIMIIFSSDVFFEKTFKNDDPDIEQKIDQYLDKVPFDRLISRHYERKDETDFVVISEDFYEEVVDCFEKQGFEVINTLPEQTVKSFIKYDNFDIDTAKNIFLKFNNLKNPKLSLNYKSMMKIKKQYQRPAENRSILILLISMLAVLAVTFLFILFMQSFF